MVNPLKSINPLDVEIAPGQRVRDLTTVEECEEAEAQLDGHIETVLHQISLAEADPTIRWNRPGWRSRAQAEIRWKKRALGGVRKRAQDLRAMAPRPPKRFETVFLDTLRDELGDTEFDRIKQIAKDRVSA